MSDPSRVVAVDLGASSGRVVLAEVGHDVLRLETVARFRNEPVRTPEGLRWDLLDLHRQTLDGLREVGRRDGRPTSIGIDSWAVDYGLLSDGHLLGAPFHYRDEGRARGVEVVHRVLGHEQLFQRNGLQFLPFNTLYQLCADPLVQLADRLLMVPDLLGSWLTGREVTERTVASTTGLLDVRTQSWDDELIERLALPRHIFGELVDPGTVIGSVLPEVTSFTGLDGVPLVAVGSHDTASAVVGTPMSGDAAYISCGTWGLVGVELEAPVLSEAARAANFTNEAGLDGTIRFHTNVMGLWLLSESMREWERAGATESLPELLAAAASLPAEVHTFDVQDPAFLPPGDMPGRILQWYTAAGLMPPPSRASVVRAIVESLAQAFADAVHEAARLAGRPVDAVNLVGGGALNDLLCQSLADRTGLPVLAGPVEATAVGNVLIQARATSVIRGDLASLRDLIGRTQAPRRFAPHPGRPAHARR